MRWFSSQARDERETAQLLGDVRRLRARSAFQTLDDADEFITDLLVEVCAESDLCPSALVAQPLVRISQHLLSLEPFVYDVEAVPALRETLADGVKLRAELRRVVKILDSEAHYLALWRAKLKIIWHGIIKELPVNVLVDPYPDGTVPHEPVLSPNTPLCHLIDDLPDLMTRLIGTFFDEEIAEPELFHHAREQFEGRLCVASGVAWNERNDTNRPVIMPSDKTNMAAAELSDLYTDQTAFAGLFTLPVPIPIPTDVRFEHAHIIGGTGHGKTQLLQYLIADDCRRALREKMSVVVVDPDGALIKNLSRTSVFAKHLLGPRTIFIDPTDNNMPVGLNLFDVSHLAGADTRTQETFENNTIELFEYFFDALIGNELTSRQSTLFRYLGLLLMKIPGGNIHTLRELMEDGKKFKPFMDKLDGTARVFFETRFFEKSLNATKQQILARLWGVLSNRSLDRVFSATRNTVQFDQAMLEGKIIFVNTSKEYFGEEGSQIFARMIVALIGQGLMRRAALPPDERTSTYIYVDEAEGVVDQTMVRLLAQVRKQKGAITLAHQHLDQLSTSARAGVLANTSIKLAGGVSASDARLLAPEFRVDKDMILAQRKTEHESNFALFAKNITPAAMNFAVPLGYVERFDRLSADEYAALIEQSRQTYGLAPPASDRVEEVESTADTMPAVSDRSQPATKPIIAPHAAKRADEALAPPTAPLEPVYRKEGGGGARHRAIQTAIKELGEAAGFRASVEETILDGEGRVDVILRRDDLVICCEVSVTTTKEHELLNVQKCLRFGADRVWLVAHSDRHHASLAKHMLGALSEADIAKLDILLDSQLAETFIEFTGEASPSETVVRGYRVRSTAKSTKILRDQITRALDHSDLPPIKPD